MDVTARDVAVARLLVDSVTETVTRAFQEHGIRSILLKGPSFDRLRPAAGPSRPYTDCDLLVAPDQLDAAREALRSLGYRPLLHADDIPGPDVHALEWLDDDDLVAVDLHTGIAGASADHDHVWSELSADTETLPIGNTDVEVLALDGLALHAALHAAHNGRSGERSLDDLDHAVRSLDADVWVRALTRARTLGAVSAFTAGLRLVPSGAAVIRELELEQVPVGRRERLSATSPPPVALGIDDLLAEQGFPARLRFLARKLVPTPRFMRAWAPLARRGRAGLVAAYVWRPVWLLLRLPAGARAWRRSRAS